MATKNAAETIEFFTPRLGDSVEPYIEANNKQGIHHVGRYEWASIVLGERRPERVLDIACGAGYGSRMLANRLAAATVIGADYDDRAIGYARKHYQADNLSYQVGDIVRWTSGNEPLGEFDAIVSFDTIEHLLHRDIALMRLADHLDVGGVLLLSTPCGHSSSKLNPEWEHHKIEYSHSDLYALLCRFFGKVIQPFDPEFDGMTFWTERVNGGQVRYLNRMNPVICAEPIRTRPYRARI